jgi:pseudouridine synthase
VTAESAIVPDDRDLLDVRGQPVERRALEIAAFGGHHLLFVGPPGCGKSMLAGRLVGLLPDLTPEAALEVAAIHSVAGGPHAVPTLRPPVRAPQTGATAAALVGGGTGLARPGELSLAHRGVLLLDELLETPRAVLDALRLPLEQGEVVIDRAFDPAHTAKLLKGIYLEEGRAKAEHVHIEGANKLRVVLTQGINRQIRRMFAALGYKVKRLTRTRLGPLKLGRLPRGAWRELTGREVESLRQAAKTSRKAARR